MKNQQTLHHRKGDCKYHVVSISQKQKKKIFGYYKYILVIYFMNWPRKGREEDTSASLLPQTMRILMR